MTPSQSCLGATSAAISDSGFRLQQNDGAGGGGQQLALLVADKAMLSRWSQGQASSARRACPRAVCGCGVRSQLARSSRHTPGGIHPGL
ncbi:MAG: hypothetical protein MZV64_60080 [Ignavibacteriales bacterium]|nr:hypothetical protein [Ignavibacteriales bacterium]